MSIHPIFIIDNRLSPQQFQNFESEAAHAAYHRNLECLIGKYTCLSAQHKSLEDPAFIGFAKTPDSIQILCAKSYNLQQLHNFIEPKYSCIGNNSLPARTWGKYFLDALIKTEEYINHAILQKNAKEHNRTSEHVHVPKQEYVVFLISTDICMLGDSNSIGFEQGLQQFLTKFLALSSQAKITIRVICAITSCLPGEMATWNDSSIAKINFIKRTFATHKKDESELMIHNLQNSRTHFEEELRIILRLCCRTHLVNIQFPQSGNTQCSLLTIFIPCTLSSADITNAGFQEPTLFSLAHRNQLDPSCLNGSTHSIRTPSYESSKHLLTSAAW